MDFEINRLRDIRSSLKKCYAFTHRHDKKRLGYLKSELTSESNPFIKALSLDLHERFSIKDDYGKEKNYGLSKYTLKNIFFNNEKLNYNQDTITNLELYCEEIEEKINQEKKRNDIKNNDEGNSPKFHESNLSMDNSVTEKPNNDVTKNWYFSKKTIRPIIFFLVTVFIILILYLSTYQWLINNDHPKSDIQNTKKQKDDESGFIAKQSKCYFNNNDGYNILIMPFRKTVTVNNVSKNIGLIIEERLDKINTRDSLNLNIHYCSDFVYDKKATDGDDADYYRQIMKKYNANHIIYGNLQDIGLNENTLTTKLQVNYCTDYEEELISEFQCDKKYDYRLTTLNELFEGKLLENIEFVLYWNAIIAAYRGEEHKKALSYISIIEDSLNISSPKLLKIKAENTSNLGNIEESIKILNRIINTHEDYPNLAEIYIIRSILKVYIQDKSALEDAQFAASLTREPESYIYGQLATSYHLLNIDLEKAMNNYDKAIEFSENAKVKAQLMNAKQGVLHTTGRYEEALNLSEESIQLSPYSHCYWINKGLNQFALGNTQKALESIDYGISLNPNYTESYLYKAQLLENLGDKQGVINSLKKLMEIQPSYHTFLLLQSYYVVDRKFSEIIELSKILLEKEPKNVDLLWYQNQAYFFMGGCEFEIRKNTELIEKLSPTVFVIMNEQENYLDIKPMYDSLSGRSLEYKYINKPKGIDLEEFYNSDIFRFK